MYRICFAILFFFAPTLCCNTAWAEVKVDIDIPSEFNESAPITATLMISHSKGEQVDINSFKLDKQPLQVELQKEEPMTATGDLVISLFRFTQEPKSKGLYILPRISVNVGGKTYHTVPRTYVVRQASPSTPVPAPTQAPKAQPSTPKAQPSTPKTQPPTPKVAPFLKLEAFVKGPQELYPGQHTVVGYRYFYNENIETTRESMPLLEAEGLIKIGDKTIKEEESGGISALQIEQMVEADKPGEYSFGPSLLEGRSYVADAMGQKIYGSQLLSSKVPEIKLKVLPFPEANKPPSFKGALGNFNWKATLSSPSTVNVGEEVKLLIEATGTGNFDTVNVPELCCQPGMSGLFNLSDLPAIGKVTGNTKSFEVKLRPLSTSIKEIPPLQFSSFDPQAGSYVVSMSDSIPLIVLPSEEKQEPLSPPQEPPPLPSAEIPLPIPAATPPSESIAPLQAEAEAADIEVESLYPLTAADLENLTFGTWWSLLIIPFGIGAILFQWKLAKYFDDLKLKPKVVTSADILANAETSEPGSSERHFLVTQALLLKLKEKGLIASADIIPEMLPTEGIVGEVRTFLCDLQEKRYTGQELEETIILLNAKELFEQLQQFGDQA